MAKVSIIGAGMTGSTTAHWLAEREIADIVLVDIMDGMPQGKALDMAEAMPIVGKDVSLLGTNDYADTKDSDIIVITAGLPRKPGMSREDLLVKNANIVGSVAEETIKYSPNAIYLILTNPLDTMTYMTMKKTGLPANKVIGQAGVLDSARMSAFIAMETGVSVQNINCFVLGGHGDSMVPLTRHSNIAGVPLNKYLEADKLEAIVNRTRKGGGEIVGLLKTGSAFYAPSAAIAQMVEAILKDKKQILPCAVYLDGEYGQKGIFFGAPVMLGKEGAEKIIEYELNDEEITALQASADAVHKSVEELKGLVEL
ncbi:MAG: malate dehydrogenase [Anaerolineae bacterium]|jgi:malate dehydrogenase|nr:malate dehydrogenase [Anaerolineae bacterium]MBT3714872.1 malate dehydrogenase [Anaerolineae bacterium]MBT4308933.1 malate dehydrogenase [Anaerolineae bacterium]MBT4457393.1 malate dehydrogenase [Anaerolineae bacterium]MBT4842935.1 malate dehydrogenase [Anaerolineae bacterium]